MKKFSTYILAAILFMCVPVLPGNGIAGGKQISDSQRLANELKVRLGLDKTQAEKLKEIFSAEEKQAKIDVGIYRSSAAALLRAAERRRSISFSRVRDILNDSQGMVFETWQAEWEKDRDLFRLTHALLLTQVQINRVALVVDEYRPRLDRLFRRLDYYIRSGQERQADKSRGAKLLGSRQQGLERRTPEVRKAEMGPPDRIRELRKERAKKILPCLTDPQQALFQEYLKLEDRELNALIRGLRKK